MAGASPVVVTYATTNRIAESHGDHRWIFTPDTGPNAGTAVEFRTASEISYSLNVAGDHVMGSGTLGPRAVAHTEVKPSGSLSGMNAREAREIFTTHCGGVLVPGTLQDVISRPGLTTVTLTFVGVIWTGDVGGQESSIGSIPTSAADFSCVDVLKNGVSMISDGRDGFGIGNIIGGIL
jgi:hypothetical protein